MKHYFIFLIMMAFILSPLKSQNYWTSVNTGIPANEVIQTFLDLGNDILAGGSGGFGYMMYKSTNMGANWSNSNSGLPVRSTHALAMKNTTIFAGIWAPDGIYKSTNSGANWTSTGLNGTGVMDIIIKDGFIFAGTSNAGVQLSTDDGDSWTAVNNGLPDNFVHEMALCGNTIFIGGNSGVYISDNNGASWTSANNGITDIGIRAFAVYGTTVYAGTFSKGVFVTTNNGANWTPINNGLSDLRVWSLAVIDNQIWAGTQGNGVFYSNDYGANWTRVYTGLTNQYVYSLEIIDNYIFAGTYGGGAYKHEIPGIPALTTTDVTSVTNNSAVSGGNVTGTGGENVTARGVVWNTTEHPSISSYSGKSTDGSGLGSFVSSLTGLTANTNYYIRAYATNTVGTGYGQEFSFLTLPNPPNCRPATVVNQFGFTINWLEPTNQGNENFTYTVEVHTSNQYNAHISGSPFTNITTTSKIITGLTPGTTYYIRVKAVNASGSSSWCETNVTTTTQQSAEPTEQDHDITYTWNGPISYILNWIRGDGEGSMLLMKSDNISSSDYPDDYVIYPSYFSVYNFAPIVGHAKLIYYGTGTSCGVMGLRSSTTYRIRIFATTATLPKARLFSTQVLQLIIPKPLELPAEEKLILRK